MDPISQALSVALKYHQSGHLQEAEQVYRQILQADPNQPDALHLLGVIARQVGMPDVAIELIGQAISIRSSSPDYHHNLGGTYLDLRKFPEAAACLRKAVQLKPDYALAHSNLGTALKELGQLNEANACCRQAAKLDPNNAVIHLNLGNVLKEEGKLELAANSYQRALHLNPQLAEANNNLGLVLQKRGLLEKAVHCFELALEHKPDSAEIHNNCGNALADCGRLDDAIARFRRAIELKPAYAEAHNNLSNVLLSQGKLVEATDCCRRALELNPTFANALTNLGNALKAQGLIDQAINCFQRSLDLMPDDAETHSNLLLTMQYGDGITLEALYQAHARFDSQHAMRLVPKTHPLGRRARPLRLGFVSADLGRHPVGNLLIRAFECLKGIDVETVCYSDRVNKDDLTARFQQSSSLWRDTAAIDDAGLAQQIQADQIDVLFDLAGHTAHNRMLTFARKPAKTQITWLGYEGTTGLSAIDFLIADRFLIPPEFERFYRERILRMPDGYVCYDPPASSIPVGPLPREKNGYLTFGSFNNPAKLTPQVIQTWAQILLRVPGSRLILKYRGMTDDQMRQRYHADFAAIGVIPDRVELLSSTDYDDYLKTYHRLDLALDPFPFNGGATTCEALWMGVPVVTCPGKTFSSRHTFSYLKTIGMTETIADSRQAYIDLAVELANDMNRLNELRQGLRERIENSPLCDGKQFAANLIRLLERL